MVNNLSARSAGRRISALLAAATLLLLSGTGCDRGAHPEQIGTRAPMFALNDGEHSVDLSKLHGHVVVLNFWASWCAPCLEELPSLEELQRDLPQVQIVAVSTDDDATAYERFLKQHSVSLLTVRDARSALQLDVRHLPLPRDLRHRQERHDPPQVHRPPGLDQPRDRQLPQKARLVNRTRDLLG